MKSINELMAAAMLSMVILSSCSGGTQSKKDDIKAAAPVVTSKSADKEKKLPFEHGSYVEEANMMGLNTKKTVYFDKWGEWTATEDKSEITIMKGYTQKNDKLEIVKGTTHWDLDLANKTGTTYETPVLPSGMEAALGAALGTAAGEKMMEGTEIKDLGVEDYLGYKCKKTQVKYAQMQMEATILAYGNLTMKMDGKMGKMDISAKITSIDLSAPPASKFEVPADIVIEKQ